LSKKTSYLEVIKNGLSILHSLTAVR